MLRDVLQYNLEVVFCGTAKGETSARLGYYYAGPGNKFYRILHQVGFTPHQLRPNECFEITQYNIGLTDLVHTQAGNDNQINDENHDVDGFINKMLKYKPKFIAFNSKKGASFVFGYKGLTKPVQYGIQVRMIGESKVFVLPSTSGSARRYWDVKYWFDLKNLITDKNHFT